MKNVTFITLIQQKCCEPCDYIQNRFGTKGTRERYGQETAKYQSAWAFKEFHIIRNK